VVSALLIAWLVPAFAHQWQDRQTERELKRDIATKLDSDTTHTVIATRILIERLFPEAQTTDARAEEVAAGSTPRAYADDALRSARERERDAAARTWVKTFEDWLATKSVTRSTLAAEFPDGALAGQWDGYASEVTFYLHLARTSNVSRRRALVSELSSFLGAERLHFNWTPLIYLPGRVPRQLKTDYPTADLTLAQSLLDRKRELVEGILRAHAAGYSTRPSDLIRDLFPFAG
jgi:hypothetical protein